MMYGYGYGPNAGAGLWAVLAMGLVGLVLLAVVVLLVVWAVRRSGAAHMAGPASPAGPQHADPALAIARDRLARGEITPEEYDAIAQKLNG